MNNIRTMIVGLLALFAFGCGYESVDNKMTGQVKKVHHNTPIFCSDYFSADISLGVLINGVGSMSTQDIEVVVEEKDRDKFEFAAANNQIVEIGYKVKRVTFCTPDHISDSIKVLQ
jgi:hypothetical protein